MQLIITEKPNVARKLAEALADGKVIRKGGKGVSYYIISRKGKEIAIAPAVGHIYSLVQKEKGRGYPVFDIEWRPAYEVEKSADYTKNYIETIEMLGKKAHEVIIACDYDIEGSLIGYNALRFACKREDGARMKFSALTSADLIEAYEERGELDLQNAQAGEARHILDWYYGINLSRALMSAIKSAGKFHIMSIGRVQGPALKLLVEKEKKIKAFIPKDYWELTCKIDNVPFKHEKEKFGNESDAKKSLEDSKNPPHIISKITRKSFEQKPPHPFDLTALQVEAYRQFRFPPTATLQIAQTLYEASMISYPRTSSQKLPAKLNIPRIVNQLAKQGEYAKLCEKLAQEKRFKPNEGKKSDPAHPAIHPTGQLAKVGVREMKLYDLIVKRFLACLAPPAKRENQKVEAKCSSQIYKTGGTRTSKQGWFEFYSPYTKFEEITLPEWKEGQEVEAKEFKMEKKQTQPPKRYTPASVISELEKENLGTKATRASIVETLFKRGYLREAKTSIEVTPFGMKVVETMGKYSPEILDAELTREIEKGMEAIQNGEIKEEIVIQDGKEVLKKILEKFKQNEKKVGMDLSEALLGAREEASRLGTCPKCKQGTLRRIMSRFKKQFVGCSNYPECTNTYPLPQGALIVSTDLICEQCNTPRVRVVRRGAKPFLMCLDLYCPTKSQDYSPKKDGKMEIPPAQKRQETAKMNEVQGKVPDVPKVKVGRGKNKAGTKQRAKRKSRKKGAD